MCLSQVQTKDENALGELILDYLKVKYPNERLNSFIYIGIQRHKLYLFQDGRLQNVFLVATAINGAGNLLSSKQTPTGLHFIKEKIGDNAPIGTLFINKNNTGEVVPIYYEKLKNPKDEITTRILSLQGKEYGLNKGKKMDTFYRGIYIHGTSEEASLGHPSSHGCVRMRNTDIVDLFDSVEIGFNVILLDN